MKILIFGTTGQLGWELTRLLAPFGEISGFDLPGLDLTESQKIDQKIREINPNLVINAAAYTNVDKAESEPEIAYAVNALAVERMAKTTAELGIGIIHYSTDYVFDGTKKSPYVETDIPDPLNIYGKSKLAGEEAVKAYAKAYWIFRTSWVFSNRKGGFVNKVLEWSHSQETLRIVDDQISNPTSAFLLGQATAILVAMGNPDITNWISKTNGLYHLAGEEYCSRYDWALEIIKNDPNKSEQVVKEILPAKSIDFPTPATRPSFSPLSCEKFANMFGIKIPGWKIPG